MPQTRPPKPARNPHRSRRPRHAAHKDLARNNGSSRVLIPGEQATARLRFKAQREGL